MYTVHNDPEQVRLSTPHESSILSRQPPAQLNGFSWSNDSSTLQATTSSAPHDDVNPTLRDGEQPRTLYSKLYERFIEKREVFVHSNIDARRSAAVNQVPNHPNSAPQSTMSYRRLSNSPSTQPPSTSYACVTKNDFGPREAEEFVHGYWELSDALPAGDYSSSSPRNYSPAPSVLNSHIASPQSSIPPVHCLALPPLPPPPPHSHRQPLPARFHSSYSELSANVAFMSEMKSQPMSSSKGSNSESTSGSKPAIIKSPTPHPEPSPLILSPVEPSTSSRSGTQPRAIARRKNMPDGERRSATPSPRASGNKALSGRKGHEVRRQPSLACFFCRERKIACGRPAEGSADRTCNQCARRAYPCDYPTESMRGQYKRRKTDKGGN